jgi:hypothetical protein
MKEFKSYIEYPQDPKISIWRYMSFSKYMSMLAYNALYFFRADKFQDKYEGFLNKSSEEVIDTLFHEYADQENMIGELKFLYKAVRKMTLINCWHMNESESDAMWKIYSLEKEGIAIQSNIERIKKCFVYDKNPFFIRPVRYIDYKTDKIKELHPTELFVRKRKCFEHEREIRVIVLRFNYNGLDKIMEKAEEGEKIPGEYVENGEFIPIKFTDLVERVYVSPESPEWFYDLVNKLTKLVYNIEVIHSKIYEGP